MNVVIVFGQMLVLLGMIAVGFFCYKKEFLDDSAAQKVSGLVVNILNPILVLNSVLEKEAEGEAAEIVVNLGLVVLYFVVLILLGNGMVRLFRPQEKEQNSYRLMTVFANVGFMGIPVIKNVLGSQAVFYLVFYLVSYNFVLYTYGIRLARGKDENAEGKEKDSRWKRMCNPGVISSVAAIIIYGTGIRFAAPVITFCDYMGNAAVPLSMLLTGVSVAQSDLKKIVSNGKMYCFIGVRMVLVPVIAAVLLRQTGISEILTGVFVLELAMPVGSIVTMLTKEYGGEENCCTDGIVLSTLLSVITIPLVCAFLP